MTKIEVDENFKLSRLEREIEQATTSEVFPTKAALDTYISEHQTELKEGQTFLIKDTTSSCYWWDGSRLVEWKAGSTTPIDLTDYVTKTGEETLTNKTFHGTQIQNLGLNYSNAFKVTRAGSSTVIPMDANYCYLVNTTGSQRLTNKQFTGYCKIVDGTLFSKDAGVIAFPNPASGETSTIATTDDITTAISNIDLSSYVTKTGVETISHKTLEGALYSNSNGDYVKAFQIKPSSNLNVYSTYIPTGESYLVDLDTAQTLSNKALEDTCQLSDGKLLSQAGGTINFPNPASGTSITLATTSSDTSEIDTKIKILTALLTNAGVINNDLEVQDVSGSEFNTILQTAIDNAAADNNVKTVSINKNYHITNSVSGIFPALDNLGSIKVQLSIDYLKVSSSFLGFYNSSKILSLTPKWWDVSDMTSMAQMFYMDTALTSLDLSKWDTSNVQSMNSMFYRCSSLATLNVSTWNTSKVKGLNGTFFQCSSLLSLDVSNWDTSNVEDMGYVFNNCGGLRSLDLRNWVDTKATNMSRMFNACTSLQTINLASFTGALLSNSTSMFAGCSNLATLICKPSLLRKIVANGETNLTIDPSALLDKDDSTTYIWTVSNLTIQSGTVYSP